MVREKTKGTKSAVRSAVRRGFTPSLFRIYRKRISSPSGWYTLRVYSRCRGKVCTSTGGKNFTPPSPPTEQVLFRGSTFRSASKVEHNQNFPAPRNPVYLFLDCLFTAGDISLIFPLAAEESLATCRRGRLEGSRKTKCPRSFFLGELLP